MLHLAGIDFDKLALLTKESVKRISAAKEKDIVLLIGRTGAGKSTTLNYLMGSRMLVDESRHCTYVSVAEGQVEYARIGHGGESQTLYPEVIIAPASLPNIAYCDCPGFADNRAREEKLCSSIGLPLAIQHARSVRAMLIHVHYSDLKASRGEGLVSLMATLGEMLNNPLSLIQDHALNPYLFIWTHVPEDLLIEEIAEKLQIFEEDLVMEETRLKVSMDELIDQLVIRLGITEKTTHEADSRAETIAQIEDFIMSRPEFRREQASLEQVKRMQSDRAACLIRLSVMQLMLANKASFYILHGNEEDDKEQVLAALHRLEGTAIAKDNFKLQGNDYAEGSQWDKIIQKVAVDGLRLMAVFKNAPQELSGLKKYKNFIRMQCAEEVSLLEKLRKGACSESELAYVRDKILQSHLDRKQYDKESREEREAKKEELLAQLAELDTDEEVLYKSRSLSEVDLSTYRGNILLAMMPALSLAALGHVGIMVAAGVALTGILGAVTGGVAAGGAKIAQWAGADVSPSEVFDNIVGVANWPLLKLSKLVGVSSHRFFYDDLPFLRAEPKPGLLKSSTTAFRESIGLGEGFGFVEDSVVEDKEVGHYEITCINQGAGKCPPASVDMFVEKRLHPDFEPKIAEIRGTLERIDAMYASYLRPDFDFLESAFLKEEHLLQRQVDLEKWRNNLSLFLENRSSEYKPRINRLYECFAGSKRQILEAQRAFIKALPRFDMISELAIVLGASVPASEFIATYPATAAALAINGVVGAARSPTVWGRKKTPDIQPDYEVKSAKVEGCAIGAEFQLKDKPDGAFWLGKIGEVGGRPAIGFAFPLAPYTQVRRVSAIVSILEKIAADLYYALSYSNFLVPKTRLAELPIENQYTKTHSLTGVLLEEINRGRPVPITEGVFVMSKYMDGYHNLSELTGCILDEEQLSFTECLARGCLPDSVEIESTKIPLKGLMEILATATLLADTDVLGGGAKNAGYIIERDERGNPIAVRAVKIDPGCSFNFNGPENQRLQSFNTATVRAPWTGERRHLQFGNHAAPILWSGLTLGQQRKFLQALSRGLNLLTPTLITQLIEGPEFSKTSKGRNLPKASPYFEGYSLELMLGTSVIEKKTVYVKTEDSVLSYATLSPLSEVIRGDINIDELGCSLSELDSIEKLRAVLPDILEIMSKRGHTHLALLQDHLERVKTAYHDDLLHLEEDVLIQAEKAQQIEAIYSLRSVIDGYYTDFTKEAEATSAEEHALAWATLDSQRAIERVTLADGVEHVCKIVNATPNGDCGFIATRRALKLLGQPSLAEFFNRPAFIQAVEQKYRQPDVDSQSKALIDEIFRVDHAANLEDWKRCFQRSGYWMEETHFRFASRRFNIAFEIYYQQDGVFLREPSYDRIYEGDDPATAITINLAHVSTHLIDLAGNGGVLNHFDTLVIDPTPIQRDEIDRKNGKPASRRITTAASAASGCFFQTRATPAPAPLAGAGAAAGSAYGFGYSGEGSS